MLAGKRTPQDVLREFVDTFDVGGEVDGKVTRSEFENYYRNISASIDDDEYFELMIRNAWRISGGQGQAANSANSRVLVTHADGRQTVEELKDDLGLSRHDREGVMRNLRAQGIDAASFALHSGGTDGIEQPHPPSSAATAAAAPRPLSDQIRATAVSSIQAKVDPVSRRVAERGAVGGPTAATRPPAPTQAGPLPAFAASAAAGAQPTSAQTSPGVGFILQKIKSELRRRGPAGFVGIQRKFRIVDDDGSKQINRGELKKALKELNIDVSESEMRLVFDHFDVDRSGSINFEEFLGGLRDPLNDRRLALVRQGKLLRHRTGVSYDMLK